MRVRSAAVPFRYAAAVYLGLVVAGICLSGGARAGTQERWVVWAASSMQRVGRTDPPSHGASVELNAAGGECESFQIVVTAGKDSVDDVDIEASQLTGPNQSTIPASNFVIFREHYVQVKHSSPDIGSGNRPLGAGWYADALVPRLDPSTGQRIAGAIPSFPFRTAAHENQPVWIDLHVPFGATKGTYRASLRLTSSQGEAQIPILLHVWGFSLPRSPTLTSSFGMHEPSLTDARVQRMLLEHRVMPVNINPGNAHEFQEQLGLNIVGLRFWGHSNSVSCTMESPPPTGSFIAELAHYPSDLPVYVYPADEIDRCPSLFETVRQWSAEMHAANPRIKNLVTVAPVPALYDDGTPSRRSAVDIWTMLPKVYDAHTDEVRVVQSKGDEIWSYTALVQDSYSPKWEIDFAPINYRIQPGFLSQALGLTGILYWRIDLWTKQPWRDVESFRVGSNVYPGEGMLIYPGADVGAEAVVPSLRLKWIRKGVEDYEYVAILKRMGRGEWAMSRVRHAATDWRHWTQDPAVLEQLRRELGDEIDRLSSSQLGN